jgi:hypothetical protein
LVGRSVNQSRGSHTNVTLPLQFRHPGLPFPTLLRPAGHLQNGLKFWLVGWLVGWSVGRSVSRLVGNGEVTRRSRWLFSFVTRARPSRPFYALRATPKTALNFGWSVGRSVGRSQGSHMNITLPIQFRHQGPPFPTLLRPVGHPQNGLKFWLVGWLVGLSVTGKSHEPHTASSVLSPGPALLDPSTPCGPPQKRSYILVGRSVCRLVGQSVGHREVTRTSRCLIQFLHPGPPSRPFYALRATPNTALNFGRSVSWLVGHGEVTRTSRCLFSFVTQARHSRPFYALRDTPKTALNFGWLVGRSVGLLVGPSVTGKSHERQAASSISSSGPALPDLSTPCGPPPKQP